MKSTIYFSALLLFTFLYGCFPDSGKVAQQEEIADTASLKIDSSLVIDAKIFQEKEFLDTVIGTWKLLGTYNP
ncbi:MAG: hypothetical protein KDE26_28505, partial [Bacteroidetes bacterium]|nr:hypothetical protein [Bacteroidota bacterium]